MSTYNLDILYKGFEDDAFIRDMQTLQTLCDDANAWSQKEHIGNQKDVVIDIIKRNERLHVLVKNLLNFTSLRASVNTSDEAAINSDAKITQCLSSATKALTKMDRYIVECKDMSIFIEEDPLLQTYRYYLHNVQKSGAHRLSDEVEEAISKMNINAGMAWEKQWEYLSSRVEMDMDGTLYGLAAMRNFAYDDDASVRKKAFECELKGYDKIKDGVAFSLNSIKGQVNTVCDMRGYESALAQALEHADMKQETLDAMWGAIQMYIPKLRQYLARKGELLGHKNGLPFYDLFASIAQHNKKYTVEEARTYLVSNFRDFCDELADMVDLSFQNEWIDFHPRKGKVGGAFCMNMPLLKQSRILTNYDGYFTDIVTLAHELGHAFHGQQLEAHRPLNLSYCMPLAETASTFNENIIMNKAISEAQGEEKIALMESQLQDVTQIIIDIYSRFLFEQEVFDRRRHEFLSPPQLEDIMLRSQKEAYGDALDNTTLHPYMWICKPHYYSTGLSFYNFPYAFGGLFARGLYAQYKKEGEAFIPKYKEMLKATTITSVEECAQIMGVDVTSKDFWCASLASFEEVVDAFLDATK